VDAATASASIFIYNPMDLGCRCESAQQADSNGRFGKKSGRVGLTARRTALVAKLQNDYA
jgi:hypothetical protein